MMPHIIMMLLIFETQKHAFYITLVSLMAINTWMLMPACVKVKMVWRYTLGQATGPTHSA
jgi:hypothetical protein